MGGAQTKQLGGFRICNYGENSLGRLLELERSFDYIVGIDGVPLTQVSDASHDFFLKRLKGIGRQQVKINVYNSLSTRIRTIILNPYKYNENTEGSTPNRRFSAESEKDGLGKNAFVDGIDSNVVEFDAPLNSLRVYQFLSYDERISGLGIGVHWEEISTKGIRVVNVQKSSPAQTSGLIANEDFIVASSTLMRPFYSTDDFLAFVKKNDKAPLSLVVYNTETEVIREILITPNSNWGGKGLLGCDIAAGPLYDIPLREKEVSFSRPHHGNITYIEITSQSMDGKDTIQYNLKEENEVISKDLLEEDENRAKDNYNKKDNCQQRPEPQIDEIPKENLLVKDYSFDLYRIKQSEEPQFDEKQGIIEQALINSGLHNIPDFSVNPTRGPREVEIPKNDQITENPSDSVNNTSESLLIISDLKEEDNSNVNLKFSSNGSDEEQNDENNTEFFISSHQVSDPTYTQTTTEASTNPESTLNEAYGPFPVQTISANSVKPSHQIENQTQNPDVEAGPLPPNSSPFPSRKIHAENVPKEPGASNSVPELLSEHLPAISSKSEDGFSMQLHAQLHELAGDAHVNSGQSTEEKGPEYQNREDSFVISREKLAETPKVEDSKCEIEQASSSNIDQRNSSSNLEVKEKGSSFDEKDENKEPKQSQNDQIEEHNDGANQPRDQDTFNEKNQVQENIQEQSFHNIENMSPEDERACEILKKLMEMHPRLDYDPPGIIEYTDQEEI
ncbi:Golgi reassembly stacking 2 [Cryptosporidium sp. chipmunk genotype I]|uniref:Golgi reassembly stacking 2 n=1 Tax=Cryptosporidium sp. chipmunk genotype I TaxID=1280935 RepID=UPI003519FC11|nr:Golgi reassembly stacking 2 [Cryptosporidium sp. chipmunk genotype I]